MIIIAPVFIVINNYQQLASEEPESPSEEFRAICPECGWTKAYTTPAKQKRGLAAHQHHCPGPMNLDVGGKLSREVERYFDRNGTTTIKRNGHQK